MATEQAQRTEQPTPRRKQKAREEGQVASSRELTAAVQFAAAVALLSFYAQGVTDGLERSMRGVFAEAFRGNLSTERLRALLGAVSEQPLSFVWVFGLLLVLISLLMHLVQTGFLIAPKRLIPELNRLNPGQKLRDLPRQNLGQFFKALLLLPLVGWVFWYVVEGELPGFLRLPKQSLSSGAATVGQALTELLWKAALVLLLLGAFDLYRQRRQILRKLMMTKQEVRQEQKDLEGHPQVRARVRRLQREMRRRRMMSEVPKASVVVTNPSHYAVALKYEPESMAAPLVVAKGLDHLALRIRQVAEKHGVPIVENPPLAQALYKSTEIGSEIPEALYRAVAEILAYIYRLSRREP